jgi:hypothetical protein
MTFGAIGDIHGDFDAVRRVLGRHPEVPFWVTVGDVGGDEGRYEDPPAPLYWIKGNNEDFDVVARAAAGASPLGNLRYVPNGRMVTVDHVRLAGLGGTFAPTWYDTPAAALPHPTPAQAGPPGSRRPSVIAKDKRRHFVREEVEACRALRGIDVFLSHEAPRPFPVGRMDAGKTPVNEILAAMRPRLHLCGHHHRFVEQVRQGVRSVCLPRAGGSYLLVDGETMEYEVVH